MAADGLDTPSANAAPTPANNARREIAGLPKVMMSCFPDVSRSLAASLFCPPLLPVGRLLASIDPVRRSGAGGVGHRVETQFVAAADVTARQRLGLSLVAPRDGGDDGLMLAQRLGD